MKFAAPILAFSISCLTPALAGTVGLFGINDNNDVTNNWVIRNSAGTKLTSGIVVAGYFNSLSDAQVSAGDFSSLVGQFSALDSSGAGANDTSIDVLLNGSSFFYGVAMPGVTALFTNYGAPPAVGKSIYIFIGNGATLASSTQFALLDSNLDIGDDDPLVDDHALTFKAASALAGKGTKTIGGETADTSGIAGFGGSVNQPVSHIDLVAIPEPSVALLGGLGVLGLVARRRRN